MFKRLCCALAAVLALAVCAVPVFGAQEAEAAGYSITSFEGQRRAARKRRDGCDRDHCGGFFHPQSRHLPRFANFAYAGKRPPAGRRCACPIGPV